MDEIERAAGVLWRYLIAKVRLGINNNDIPPSPARFEYELRKGVRVFDGIVVEPKGSPIIENDEINRDFLDALNGSDEALAIDADKLHWLRQFVLHGKKLPFPTSPEPKKPGRGAKPAD